jgi:hypothetical protein
LLLADKSLFIGMVKGHEAVDLPEPKDYPPAAKGNGKHKPNTSDEIP